MVNYTTPTVTLVVEAVDITAFDVYVSFEQFNHELTKTGADLTMHTETDDEVTNTVIEVQLSQEESAVFYHDAFVDVQVNWIDDGVRAATEIKRIKVGKNLLDEVIE